MEVRSCQEEKEKEMNLKNMMMNDKNTHGKSKLLKRQKSEFAFTKASFNFHLFCSIFK